MKSLTNTKINNRIYKIRNKQVMLDRDLAELYEVKTKRLNEQVKRNIQRFPKDFMFQLTKSEKMDLVAECDRLSSLKFSISTPYVFTEQGVSMLSGILKSKTAININIQIIRAFVNMRKILSSNELFLTKFDNIEKRQLNFEIKTDEKFEKIFNLLETKEEKKQGIFFDGQIFDAYNFISNLIRKAKHEIILIDNYVDDSVLTLLSINQIAKITIYTKTITKRLKLDLEKYNSQYKEIKIKELKDSHDRFLIIDNQTYHIGASLKDLGKKWFAFSKFDKTSLDILKKLK